MSSEFTIKPKKIIPYWEPRSIQNQLGESSSRRDLSRVGFIFRKFKLTLLTWLAYYCPGSKFRITLNRWKGVNIGKGVFIGPACILEFAYPEYIYIEDNASLTGDIFVLAHNNPARHMRYAMQSYVAPTIVREGAWVGVRSTILPGSEIGKYALISAGTIVSGKVPEKAVVAGNPPKKIATVVIK